MTPEPSRSEISSSPGSFFSPRAFGQGLTAALMALMGVGVALQVSGDKASEIALQRLASQTAIVDWIVSEKPRAPAAPSAAIMGPFQPGTAEDFSSTAADTETDITAPAAEPVPMESGLAEAPVQGLFEETAAGRLPVVRTKDGLTPFAAYKRPFDVNATPDPLVAVAVFGLGLSDMATESAIRAMPPEVSLVLSPYASAPEFWIKEARSRGHEVWLTLPMESAQYPVSDPGPHTMLIGTPERENMAKLEWLMSRGDGYIGFVSEPRADFLKAANDMRPVIGAIYNRGLGFVDGSIDPGMIPQTMALGMKAPYVAATAWPDKPDPSPAAIAAALAEIETLAREKGYAVAIIQPLPVSYQIVQKWIEELPRKGLRLAPMSAVTGY